MADPSDSTDRKAPSQATRPPPLQISKSFSRLDEGSGLSPRKRTTTLQEAGIPAVPEARPTNTSSRVDGKAPVDVFEERHEEQNDGTPTSATDNPQNEILPTSSFDELPIEIKSLTERFLERLTAKVHPQPLTADALSDLFQKFYERAESHIATHIASLASRIGRGQNPEKAPSRKQSWPIQAKRVNSNGSNGGEMLTPSEVAERRKARRHLEIKRAALEETVERIVTVKLYERLWKHRTTDDEARDEKLRSRAAALNLVGIGLKELHMDTDPKKEDVRKAAAEREDEIHQSLAPARAALTQMNSEQYPLGKVRQLTLAHSRIVETLSEIFPSSSSADEILPTLIYTIITSTPDDMNLISNLNFIQRFRASSKVDGEAAYCLVNLEAAISFLETVDLSSLRADELPQGPGKSASVVSTPTVEADMQLHVTPKPSPAKVSPSKAVVPDVTALTVSAGDSGNVSDDGGRSGPSTPSSARRPQLQVRRVSQMVQAQADRLEAGRQDILKSADKIYDSINGTLENSFQFVFGRLKDQVYGADPIPKTLEDARKLVSSPQLGDDEDNFDASGRSTPSIEDPLNIGEPKIDNKVLELISGRKSSRDHSVDSANSTGSGKRIGFGEAAARERAKDEAATPSSTLFQSINPLNRFNVAGFARFGRSGSVSTPPAAGGAVGKLAEISELPKAQASAPEAEDLNAAESLAVLRKIKPPKKRFLDVQSAADLRIGEVEELLLEYRRLAKAIGEAIAP